MTKTKNLLSYLLTNSAFATFIYFGVVKGIPGFMNVLTFFIWFVFIIFLLAIPNEEAQRAIYERSKNQFKLGFIGKLISVIYIGVLVYYGHILLGSIYLVTLILSYSLNQQGKKLVEGVTFETVH
jgi:hypothetical protein